jgi:Leucine-rich repeat (LRR) protein
MSYSEAVRRINDFIAGDKKSLDLSYLNLKKLPPELADLSIDCLYLSGNKLTSLAGSPETR